MPKAKRKPSAKKPRKKPEAKTSMTDSLDRASERASEKFQAAQKKFEPILPILPRIAGKLSPEAAELDKFEKFARAIKKVQTLARKRIAERKRTFFLKALIILIIILLGINLALLRLKLT